ncbi:MAG: hypothetical protein E3J87_04850 [Candidatus Cloacimonadota bacterium]|nr:MAG: hypothetical protein E3J87_04850 [Candidatus Cloacimonadota bacterium]
MLDISLRQIEAICEEEGAYIAFLKKEIANQNGYLRDIYLIKLIKREFNIPEEFINLLIKQGNQLFFEFSLKEEKEYISFFNKVTRLKEKESILSPEFNKYKNKLSQTYKNVLEQEREAALVFEIGYINKAGEYIRTILKNESGDKLTKEILFMKKIIEFSSNIRKELSNDFSIPVSFFVHSIDQFPYASIIEHPLTDFEPLFLSRGFPLSLFKEIHNIFLSDISQRQIVDLVNVVKEKTFLSKGDLRKCKFSRFIFPQNKELKILFKSIIRQSEKSEIELIKNDKELSLIEHRVSEQTKRIVREKAHSIAEVIDAKNKKPLLESSYRISEVLSEIEKACLDYIWHIKDFSDKSYNLSQKIESNRSLQTLKMEELNAFLNKEIYHGNDELVMLAEEFLKIEPFLEISQSKIERMVIQKTYELFNKTEKEAIKNREKIREILLTLREGGRRKYYPDVNEVIKRYKKSATEILLPLLIFGLLQRNIKEWPQINKVETISQSRLYDETNYFSIYAIPRGSFYHFSQKGKIRSKEDYFNDKTRNKLVDICEKYFKKLVTVLIYDIRGSSFMTLKLHNAEREQMIIKNFHSTMTKIAKEYGAFLLKDIGDGGIIWFGANSKELYNSIYRESTTKKFKKLRHSLLSEEGLFLQSSLDSSSKAIRCAISMEKAAEKFIKDNYVKYRDWFSDIKEKELIVEGTTYALLPPMFRSLFRLGIGIASGIPSRDVAIGPNAFGDPDLRGMLVNEAKFLSEGRDPEKSVILADHDTVFNLLLTIPKFTLGEKDSNVTTKEEMMSRVAEIVKEKLQGGVLNLSGKNFVAEPFEILSLDTFEKEKYTPTTLKLDEDGILYNEKGKRVKILYLIRA